MLAFMLMTVGCVHCSLTKTNFKGRTTGINPYGSGDITVNRTSLWGTHEECITNWMEDEN